MSADDARPRPIQRPWAESERRIPRRIVQPLQAFLHTEAAGGIVLLVATMAALLWANVWPSSYERFWQTSFSVTVGSHTFGEDLTHVVNDGLMAVFFFVVGLEIKRELVAGELRTRSAAALPVLAALGGMILPALIFVAVNVGTPEVIGWGIPMATDIAFAVGVLGLVGRGLLKGVRTSLLALAIVDDIGAVIVIALFYSQGISVPPLLEAAGLLLAILILRRMTIRAPVLYWALGLAVWFFTWRSGVHATIAGVALGLITPATPFQPPADVSAEAHRIADRTEDNPEPPDADAGEWLGLARLSRQAVSPATWLETLLHPWSSYVVIPIFALANAGVRLTGESVRAAFSSRLALGIIAGLVVGKMAGITLGCIVGVKSGLARLPRSVGWGDVMGAAALAGIGFTVSLFITGLAFTDRATQDAAKIAILAGSSVAAILGSTFLIVRRRRIRR